MRTKRAFKAKKSSFTCKKLFQTWESTCKKSCSENMQQIYEKTSVPESNFIEIALRHGCSPVNLLHVFGTPFPRNKKHLRVTASDFWYFSRSYFALTVNILISERPSWNNFWPELFSAHPLWKIIFKAPNLMCTSYFSGSLEEEKVLELR